MSVALRVELKASLTGTLTDPGGVFWAARVEDWRKSFQGTAYTPTGTPCLTTLPSRAIVWMESPNSINERERDILRRYWSDRVWSVDVVDVTTNSTAMSCEEEKKQLSKGSVSETLGKAANTVSLLSTLAIVGVGIWAVSHLMKRGGTQSW